MGAPVSPHAPEFGLPVERGPQVATFVPTPLSQAAASGMFVLKNQVQVLPTDNIRLGTAPGGDSPINIDTFGSGGTHGIHIIASNGSASLRIDIQPTLADAGIVNFAATGRLVLGANALNKWNIAADAAGTCSLVAMEPVGRIVPGATSFVVRDTGNANDIFSVLANGNVTAKTNLIAGTDLFSGNNAAIGVAGTAGFVFLSTCAGAPTGVPANNSANSSALRYDSTNKKLWVYDTATGAWKGVVVA